MRDKLLGYPSSERDWVVVGSTPEQMRGAGFRPVGNDFPVFLHPETGEEYALARTERKSGRGYHGFTFHADPSVTLEQDLARRDLTINAMAERDGHLVDPFNGRADLEQKLLRHVSPAFAEDPLRILRVARFAARYNHLGFTIAPETQTLMRQMVAQGEVDHLVPERIWKETERALLERNPEIYFQALQACAALLPVSGGTWRRSANDWWPLQYSAQHNHPAIVRFAALFSAGEEGFAEALCERWKVPRRFSELALMSVRFSEVACGASSADAAMDLLQQCDALRRPERFEDFLAVCSAKGGDANTLHRLRSALNEASTVTARRFVEAGLKGEAIGEAVAAARRSAVREAWQ